MTDVSKTCAVVIFKVKVNYISSADGTVEPSFRGHLLLSGQ